MRSCKSSSAGARSEPSAQAGEASGQLRINLAVNFGALHLAPLWPAFKARKPKLALDATLADRLVDLVDEGCDLAVRIARLQASSLVIRQLASTRMSAPGRSQALIPELAVRSVVQ